MHGLDERAMSGHQGDGYDHFIRSQFEDLRATFI